MTARLVAILLAVWLAFACTGRDPELAGAYVAKSETGTVTLTLSPDGKGAWTHEGETAPLTWERRASSTIWLHTRDGGVIACRLTDKGIETDAPSWGALVFTRSKQ